LRSCDIPGRRRTRRRAISILLDTYSDHALLAPEYRAPLYQAIAEVLERRGGMFEVLYVALAFVARRR